MFLVNEKPLDDGRWAMDKDEREMPDLLFVVFVSLLANDRARPRNLFVAAKTVERA